MTKVYLDHEVVAELFEGIGSDPDTLKELFQMYLDTTPKFIEEIKKAFQKNDAKLIAKLAHSLKSSSASLGLRVLAEDCQWMEANSLEWLESQDHVRLSTLESNFLHTQKLCEEYLKQLTQGNKAA